MGRSRHAAVAPSSPSPRELPPVPPSPVDEGVASSSHRACETQSAETEPNERSETPPGPIRRLHPTVAPAPAREGWWCSLLSRRRSRSAAHRCESKVHRSCSIQPYQATQPEAALREARV